MKINRSEKVQPLETSRFKSGALNGKKLLATGTLKHFSRKDIEEVVKLLGGTYVTAVSQSLDYLICGEDPGSKVTKAEELRIKIINEEDFIELITIPKFDDSTQEIMIDLYIQGYGYISDFKLFHETDMNNIKLAMMEKADFEPNFFFLDVNEELYDALYDTDYEISDKYFEGYMSSLFEPGFHEITIVETNNEDNKIILYDDVYDTSNEKEILKVLSNIYKDTINDSVNSNGYSHILLIVQIGKISEFEESITLNLSKDLNKLQVADIDFNKIHEITILGNQINLSGENWDLIDGDDMLVVSMPINEFLELQESSDFSLDKYDLLDK